MRTLLIVVAVFACASVLARQNEQPSSPVLPDEPKACVEFDQMAVRVEAVATTETITEQEFRRMATWPGVVVRNPGYVFDIGNSQYVASKNDDKEIFQKTTTHKDKEADFLRWYNHGGRTKMMFTALKCSDSYNSQVRSNTDRVAQFTLQGKEQQVWITITSAMQIDSDSTEKSLLECVAKIADAAKPRNP